MKSSEKDPFLGLAIKFILSVVIGFTLFLMGFIFLFLALLGFTTESTELPPLFWLFLGLFSVSIGVYLMYNALKGSPTPGTYPSL